MSEEIKGYFHSKETFGTVDGPGIRYVAFMQGCNLRCKYCHNPDTWKKENASYTMTVDELIEDILKYKSFIRSGGVTFSGGEPLLQPEFIEQAIDRLHSLGISVAIDTAGFYNFEKAQRALTECDLVLLDIKAIDEDMCKDITGQSNSFALKVLEYREKIKKPVWIRHVIVPNYTLDYKLLEKLADYLKDFSCVEMVEILPFHKLGEYKWKTLGEAYSLEDTPVPENEEVIMAKEIFKSRGLNVH
ncbi:MAG: pyruvate formate lyase-activating protein [Clostridiales bacterium]|nr:pyruvate formate lyase-activating protein [Clostridiales bacterium]